MALLPTDTQIHEVPGAPPHTGTEHAAPWDVKWAYQPGVPLNGGLAAAFEVFNSPSAIRATTNAPYINFGTSANNTDDPIGPDLPTPIQINAVPDGFPTTHIVFMASTFVNVLEAGNYVFRVTSDDGHQLTLNGEVISESLGPHGADSFTSVCHISQPGVYPITYIGYNAGVEYYHRCLVSCPGDHADISLSDGSVAKCYRYNLIGQEVAPVPAETCHFLGCADPFECTAYFSRNPLHNMDAAVIMTTDPSLQLRPPVNFTVNELYGSDDRLFSFSFGRKPPDSPAFPFRVWTPLENSANDNNYVLRWRAQLDALSAGKYEFEVRSDDGLGVRMLVGDHMALPSQIEILGSDRNLARVKADGTVEFPVGTADANTRFTVTLPQGPVDFSAMHYDGGSGSHFSVRQRPLGTDGIPLGGSVGGSVLFPQVTGLATVRVEPLLGDVNDDGIVNFEDNLRVRRAWGSVGSAPEDLNHDGRVDLLDLRIVFQNLCRQSPNYVPANPPPPGGLDLLVNGNYRTGEYSASLTNPRFEEWEIMGYSIVADEEPVFADGWLPLGAQYRDPGAKAV